LIIPSFYKDIAAPPHFEVGFTILLLKSHQADYSPFIPSSATTEGGMEISYNETSWISLLSCH